MTFDFVVGLVLATLVWWVLGFVFLMRWFYQAGTWIEGDVRRMTLKVKKNIDSARIAIGNNDTTWAKRSLESATETIDEFHRSHDKEAVDAG